MAIVSRKNDSDDSVDTPKEVSSIEEHAKDIFAQMLASVRAGGTHTMGREDVKGLASAALTAAKIFAQVVKDGGLL